MLIDWLKKSDSTLLKGRKPSGWAIKTLVDMKKFSLARLVRIIAWAWWAAKKWLEMMRQTSKNKQSGRLRKARWLRCLMKRRLQCQICHLPPDWAGGPAAPFKFTTLDLFGSYKVNKRVKLKCGGSSFAAWPQQPYTLMISVTSYLKDFCWFIRDSLQWGDILGNCVQILVQTLWEPNPLLSNFTKETEQVWAGRGSCQAWNKVVMENPPCRISPQKWSNRSSCESSEVGPEQPWWSFHSGGIPDISFKGSQPSK